MKLGRLNNLEVLREAEHGFYLDAEEYEDILLPRKYAPDNIKIGDVIEVMVYLDSEERLIATTETPLAQVGDFAMLQVVASSEFGVFMDWGLTKQLFVPFAEQNTSMQVGKSYLVYVHIDERTERIIASTKLGKFLHLTYPPFQENDELTGTVWTKTELGYKIIIGNTHLGMLYANEVFKPLEAGEKIKVFIKKIREDLKIDLSLHTLTRERFDEFSELILEKLSNSPNCKIELGDASPPEAIYDVFQISKKNFKKAIGKLYKERMIEISDHFIQLTPKNG